MIEETDKLTVYEATFVEFFKREGWICEGKHLVLTKIFLTLQGKKSCTLVILPTWDSDSFYFIEAYCPSTPNKKPAVLKFLVNGECHPHLLDIKLKHILDKICIHWC